MMQETIKCFACNSHNTLLFEVGRSTVSGYRCDTVSESENAPLFDITLNFCTQCNLVSQRRFSKADALLDKLYAEHESTQHSEENPEFHRFAAKLGSMYALSDQSKVLEIGCNCGAFLKTLRETTKASVFGLEPSKTMEKVWLERSLTVINQYMDTNSVEQIKTHGPFDVIYFRHVFEHVPDPVEFIRLAQTLLTADGAIVLEVPYLDSIVKYERHENISYSHLHHYCIKSLNAIFSKFEMGMTDYELVSNDGGSIIAHFRKGVQTDQSYFERDLDNRLRKYISRGRDLKAIAQKELQNYPNGSVVGYGAGAKGQHLIHLLELEKYINKVIDDTPGFDGKFIPGTSIEIVCSDILQADDLSAVINLAPTHREAIKAKVPSNLVFIDFINDVGKYERS